MDDIDDRGVIAWYVNRWDVFGENAADAISLYYGLLDNEIYS